MKKTPKLLLLSVLLMLFASVGYSVTIDNEDTNATSSHAEIVKYDVNGVEICTTDITSSFKHLEYRHVEYTDSPDTKLSTPDDESLCFVAPELNRQLVVDDVGWSYNTYCIYSNKLTTGTDQHAKELHSRKMRSFKIIF